MSSLSFLPVSDGLYVADGAPSATVTVRWVLLDGAPPAGPLDAGVTWSTYSGCYAFSPADQPVADPRAFVAAVRQLFGAAQSTVRGLAWIADPAAVASTALTTQAVIGVTPGVAVVGGLGVTVPFGNVQLTVSKGSFLSYDPSPAVAPDVPALVLSSVGAQGGIVGLTRDGASTNLLPDGGAATVPLGGPAAGRVVFPATWDRGDLYTFFADQPSSFDTPPGNEVRYFTGPAVSEQALRYPVFVGQVSSQDPTQRLALDVSLDPFDPWDPARTVLGLDVARSGVGADGPTLPTSTTFAATDGSVVELVPQQGAGFALGLRPRGTSTDDATSFAYLTPTGTFDVQPLAGTPGIRHLMGGTTGTEFLLVAPGATVTFVPQSSAYAPSFAPSGGGSHADPCHPAGGDEPVVPGTLLRDTYTTAWLRVDPPAASAAPVDRGYAVQPSASVYYGTTGESGSEYPLALGCRVSTLADGGGAPTPVPMAPYAAVWKTGATQLPDASVLRAFESQVLAATRLVVAPRDPTNGPAMFALGTHAFVDGGAVMTPDGLLAQLNGASTGRPGTFETIELATSPNVSPLPGAGRLAFTGSPVVAPDLGYALVEDGLFLVVTDPAALGGLGVGSGFENVIQVGEWTFRLDVDLPQDGAGTILVVKLTTALSVVDLVGDTAYWNGWQTFIGPDPATVKTVQTDLNALLCQASEGADGVFAAFWATVNDPSWTGVLAMNCGLDVADLPDDIQDLMGGIDGELRGHHLGVTVNRVRGADSASWQMDASSIFALIHYARGYAAPAKTDFAFQVLRLDVQIENSVLTHFDSRIAITIPTLFSTEVVLPASTDPDVPAGYNVVEIDGVYQRHGDSGTIVFDTKDPQAFSFDTGSSGFRVLNEAYVTDATLVPVSTTTVPAAGASAATATGAAPAPAESVTTVTSRLALSGALLFAPDVSAAAQSGSTPTAPPMDLFSYGEPTASPPTGLGFDGYAIAMTTRIVGNVGTITSIGPDLGQLRATPATSTTRAGSLLAALPLKLASVAPSPGDPGWPVTFDGAASGAPAPTYVVRLQASLGSLGALLSSTAGLDVDLELGWRAGTGSANDALWLTMVPPAAMQGQLGFGIDGVLDATFTSVGLSRARWPAAGSPSWTVYGISFANVNVAMLGMLLLPGTGNFTLFAPPAQGANANIGWLTSFVSPIVPPPG